MDVFTFHPVLLETSGGIQPAHLRQPAGPEQPMLAHQPAPGGERHFPHVCRTRRSLELSAALPDGWHQLGAAEL